MAFDALPYLRKISIRPDAQFDPESHPFDIPATRALIAHGIEPHAAVTFLVGENGAGKSTILEAVAIALGFSAEGGSKHIAQLRTVDSASGLHESLRLAMSYKAPRDGYFLRAESLFNVATHMDALGSKAPSMHGRSHGEAFLGLLTGTFRGQGLYLLDEPEAALSPQRQLAALCAIHRLVQDGSQFIIATHSPILMAYPDSKILHFSQAGIEEMAYEDSEQYRTTLGFLSNHKRRMELLLAADGDEPGRRGSE